MSRLFDNAGHLSCTLSSPIATSDAISVFFWIKKTDWSTNADNFVGIGQSTSSLDQSLFVWNSATADKVTATSRTTTSSNSALTFASANEGDGIWVPVLAVWNGDASRIVHALYPRQSSTVDTTSVDLNTLDEIVIGRSNALTNGVNGYIAEVCIWTRALSTSDYALLVTAAETGKKPGELYPSDVIGYWSFATSALTDESGNGNTLTLTGTANYDASHPTITAFTTTYLKLLAHSSAASATSIEGVVLNAARDTVIGEFTGQAFEASLESGEAVLKVDVDDIVPDGDTLTTSDTPLAIAYNATYTTPLVSCTVIEE